MKRILALLLIILLLTGCGAPKEEPAPTQTVPSIVPTESTQTEASSSPTKPTETMKPTEAPTETVKPTETVTPTEPTDPPKPTETVPSPTKPKTGWVTENGKTYYVNADGNRHIGWLKLDGQEYYLKSDGSLARGKTVINGLTYYFTSTGARVILVNPWHFIPYNYDPELVKVEGYTVAIDCRDALVKMLADCRAAGNPARICSAYRTQQLQIELYNNKVNYYLDLNYAPAAARDEAAKSVAIPGTSEHQLGLAVDLVDNSNWNLDESQEKTPTQKWLMEHCWEYGFILRYPNGKTDKTGIIYEPWHYRYVGKELAMELKNSGLCLEEYFDTLQ